MFREVTFKLNTDFDLYIKLWFYEEQHGWREYEGKMLEGNENYIMVREINDIWRFFEFFWPPNPPKSNFVLFQLMPLFYDVLFWPLNPPYNFKYKNFKGGFQNLPLFPHFFGRKILSEKVWSMGFKILWVDFAHWGKIFTFWKKKTAKTQNNGMSDFCWATYPPCPILLDPQPPHKSDIINECPLINL